MSLGGTGVLAQESAPDCAGTETVDYCVDIPGCCGVGEVKTTSSLMMHTCKTPRSNGGHSSSSNWQADEIWDMNLPAPGAIRIQS